MEWGKKGEDNRDVIRFQEGRGVGGKKASFLTEKSFLFFVFFVLLFSVLPN